MSLYYVPTDSKGIEHTSTGRVRWNPPAGDNAVVTTGAQPLVLRHADTLLEVLDECVYRAEPVGPQTSHSDDVLRVESARLISRTPWDTESASRFAIDVAQHALAQEGEVCLPDGSVLREVLSYARQVLDGTSSSDHARLGYLARVRALRRLRQERTELSDLSFGLVVSDEARLIDALDDPAYASVITVADSVLAAIEALHHHVFPELYLELEDTREGWAEHDVLDQHSPGPVMSVRSALSAGIHYEPAWTSAREAARHARMAAKDRSGDEGELSERRWQAQVLEALLTASH
jgi:hypothetical protein